MQSHTVDRVPDKAHVTWAPFTLLLVIHSDTRSAYSGISKAMVCLQSAAS